MLIISCSSVYYLNNGSMLFIIICIISFLVLVLRPKKKIIIYNRKHLIRSFFLYLILLSIVILFMPNKVPGFYFRFLIFIPLMMLYTGTNSIAENYTILIKIKDIINFLAISSLIMWLLGPIAGIIKPIGTIEANWGGLRQYNNYYYLLFTEGHHYKLFGSTQVMRNLSIFPEGPFSSLVFTIGLCLELFVNHKPENKTIIILTVAIVSALSSTGLILIIVMFGTRYIQKQYKKSGAKSATVIIRTVIIPILIIGIAAFGVTYILDDKQTNDTGNYLSHMRAFGFGYTAFLSRPLTGYGYNYADNLGNSTSGLFKILVYGGLPLTALYAYPFISYLARKYRSKEIDSIIMCLVVLVLFVLVIWQNSALLLFFISLFWIQTKKK